ncbi:hypothetical protein EV44_g5649 [Erysiphe necator]|uniref:Uncharacterized protein n=1 Tax=Uncinula necator TaxID=52586 RepID=A0A0B1P1Z9_UNCNE|nr:hypothetical protein EV44_g5649 [Erysiphe necator]
MLDENLPCYSLKPSTSGNPLIFSIFLGENGSEPRVVYNLQKLDLSFTDSKGCYAIGLVDPYNLGILYADVKVEAEWTQPTYSSIEVRAQDGASTALVPTVPESFIIQLYNPYQQITVKQKIGIWSTSAYWKFEIPVESFRIPSSSLLDQTQNTNAPALSNQTPCVTFKWKRDGKISKNITCYMVVKNDDGKRRKEPDITIAFFKGGKGLTLYEPNLRRVEIQDQKGFEIILLLSALVIKDIFFNPTKEIFNISSSKDATSGLKTKFGTLEVSRMNNSTPMIISDSSSSNSNMLGFKSNVIPQILNPNVSSWLQNSRDTKSDIDQETERLKKLIAAEEKSRKDAKEEEERRTREMLRAEEEERRLREAKVEKETEELRKLYGTESISSLVASPKIESKPCKMGSKLVPTPLRISPVVTGWLETRRKLSKSNES